jgi:polar amino acid transport system substrate-binding protein
MVEYTVLNYNDFLEERKMKRILALMLCAFMLVACLAACGEPAVDDNKNNADTTAANDTTVADDTTAAGDDEAAKVLKMGTNAEFPPYEFMEGDAIVGIDAEIAAAIADILGKKLVIEDMAFDATIPALQAGKIDFIMAGLTVTEERQKSVNFTESYATGVQVVIVKEGSEITSSEDLFAPKADGSLWTVGVQQGTTGDLYTTWDLEEIDAPTAQIERYNKGADAVQALVAGKVDCVVIDNEPAKSFVKANTGLKILEGSYTDEDYAICVAKENTKLLEDINKALDELKADGTIDRIINKYIPAEAK